MASGALADALAAERGEAVRVLLGRPLLDAGRDTDEFRLVARHAAWLAEWFESSCGWRLRVDIAAGYARLAKRAAVPAGPARPLRRRRSSNAPFDQRRYQLLCLVCAELVRMPATTVGWLAKAITADAALDTSRRGERTAFVDALLVLADWGVLGSRGGDVEAFIDDQASNALLTADTARLHQLLASSQAPSVLSQATPTAAAAALEQEPRYGTAATGAEDVDEEQRLRWVRHRLARRVLDDPAVHAAELSDAEREYLANPAGRRWVRDRAVDAGLVLEERSDGLLAVDPSSTATDTIFPAPAGNAAQLALLLVDRLVRVEPDGSRRLVALAPVELRRFVDDILRRFPGWASAQREGDGPQRLARQAVARLVDVGLARRDPDGTLVPLPAVARYRVGEARVIRDQGSLFEEET